MSGAFDCRQAERFLADRLASPGPAPTLPALEAHLQGCPDCRERATRLHRLINRMRESDAPDPGPEYWAGFAARVRDRIERQRRPLRGDWRPWAWTGTAAAAILVGIVWLAPFTATVDGLPPGGEAIAPALPGFSGTTVAAGISGETDAVEGTLDAFLGGRNTFEIIEGAGDLSLDERRELLKSLRAELEESA